MKTFWSIVIVIVFVLGAVFLLLQLRMIRKITPPQTTQNAEQNLSEETSEIRQVVVEEAHTAPEIVWPISKPLERITKKPFGIQISPQNSPVSPERFTGIHTGTDFEALPGEDDTAVPVNVICTGEVLRKQFGRGYGGMIVQSCSVNSEPVVVTYGHVSLESSPVKIGDTLEVGQFLANLGKGFSSETDGERKHLHLGIHKGTSVVTSGYVANEATLEQYLNIQNLVY